MIAVVGIAGSLFLVRSHSSHVVSVIPYVILLLCPLMHIFTHKNHGHSHGGGRHHEKTEQKER